LRIVPAEGYETGAPATVADLRKRWPKPTNAQALAILAATGEPATVELAIAHGTPERVAIRYYNPTGILPRLRLLAAGWGGPDASTFKQPTASWWGQPFAYALYDMLDTWFANEPNSASLAFGDVDALMAGGNAAAIAHELQGIAAELALIEGAGMDEHPPFLVPKKPGELPIANPKFFSPSMWCKDTQTGARRLWRKGDVPCDTEGRLLDPVRDKGKSCTCEAVPSDEEKGPGGAASRGAQGLLILLVLIGIGMSGRKRR
jgi:hypothetical protein